MAGDGKDALAALSDERLRLEREAFELERGRLEAARARAEAELKLARSGHPFLVFASVTLLALFAFAGGMLLGISVNEGRHQRQREARLKAALSQLSGIPGGATAVTNMAAIPPSVLSPDQHRNVSVVVFQ